MGEVNDILQHFKSWTKPKSIKTPVSILTLMQFSAWHHARFSRSRWESPWLFLPGITLSILLCRKWQQRSLREML
jgi:hypothetical protein